MDKQTESRFQVNLSGIIKVLSEHLYSTPRVAFRELLQNGVDAVTARARQEPGHEGQIGVELIEGGGRPHVVVEDNGAGLTEDEIHRFLATIGGSSKGGDEASREAFLGQFGIGLLSCLVISDEIVVVTKSAAGEGPVMEWRGRGDGTYQVRRLGEAKSAGTSVYLAIKPEFADLCEEAALRRTLEDYGEFLGVPVEFRSGGRAQAITRERAPWSGGARPMMTQGEMLEAGKRWFGGAFMDLVPVRSAAGGVEGVAFVSKESRSLQARPAHRAYLKGMLLSERVEGLVPEWAVFVHLAVNVTKLSPTASREGLMEGERLERAREEIGECLIDYLRRLSATSEEGLRALMRTHHLALKSLALEDDRTLRLLGGWFEFETTQGSKTFLEIAGMRGAQYTRSLDGYRQLAVVAEAEGRCLINAGYVFDAELMAALVEEHPEAELEAVEAAEFAEWLDETPEEEAERFERLLKAGREALREQGCALELRAFRPTHLPVLYAENGAAETWRTMERAKEEADPLFASLLGDLEGRFRGEAENCLYLNSESALIRRLGEAEDEERMRTVLGVLYVQALIMGRQPLTERSMQFFSASLMRLIEMGL